MEEVWWRRRPVGVPANRVERLVHLLRLLRPAPQGWVSRAQRIFFEVSVLTERDVVELERKLQINRVFRQQFDSDPVAAAENAGMRKLALQLKRELHGLIALAERIASDDVFRSELNADPVAAVVSAGIPAEATEPLLQALAVPDEVLAKLPDVVAHHYEEVPRATRLVLLLLESSAVVEKIRAAG